MKLWIDIISKDEKTRQLATELFEKYNFKNLFSTYYEVDIRIIRKMKLSKLENNTKYDDIIKVLFNSENVKFLEKSPIQGESATTGSTGTTGMSGIAGIDGMSGIDGITSEELEKELIELDLDKAFLKTLVKV